MIASGGAESTVMLYSPLAHPSERCVSGAAGLNLPAGGAVYPVMGREVDVMVSGRHRQRQMGGWPQLALRVAGTGLLAASAGIHLYLHLTGYRSIPAIGWLFLLQVIAGFALAAVVLAPRSRFPATRPGGSRSSEPQLCGLSPP